jgi:hypothetical protein
MKIENLRTIIRESIQEYVKEIDDAAENAAMEARISKCDEAIAAREAKLNNLEESELRELMDDNKIKELHNEIKELKKAKAKFEKQKEKKAAKKAPKAEKEEDVVTDAVTEEAPIATEDIMAEMDTEEVAEETAINESFLKMQKLAGVITESQYHEKLQTLSELEAKDVKKGETYMYKWSDKYAPIKVKILGNSNYGDDSFVVEALEDKDGLKQGNQYIAKAEALSPIM